METYKNRNISVDFLRGLAVIGVLLGHALQRGLYPIDFNTIGLTKFIYSWHMQLFILLSGYTLCLSIRHNGKISIWKKFKRLVIPTYVWSWIIYIVHDFDFVGIKPFRTFEFGVVEYIKILLIQPTYIIWFLWVVFIFTIVVYGVYMLTQRKGLNSDLVVIFLSLFVFSGLSLIETNMRLWGWDYLKQYYVFFVVGYVCACLKEEIVHDAVKIVFILLAAYFSLYKLFYSIETAFPSQLTAFFMISFLYLLVCKCQKILKITEKNIICWLGKNSLYLYLYQFLCLNIGVGGDYQNNIHILYIDYNFSSVGTFAKSK